jgi:O-antigen/teichoic acid export membrane protein
MESVNTGESSKVFKGLSQQTIITVIYAVIQLAYFSIMSRLLSKEDFGYYAILSAITYVLMEISQAGLGSAVIQKKDCTPGFVKTAFTLSVLFGSFFTILLMLFSGLISAIQIGTDFLKVPMYIMAAALFFSTISSVSVALFMRNLQFIEYGIIQILSSLTSSLLGVLMAYLGYGVYSLVIAIFLNFFLIAVITIFFKRSVLGLEIAQKDVSGIVSYGGWLTASGVIRSLYEQMDRIITTRWISVVLLGTYTRIAGFVINVSSNVNSIFDTILFPIVSGIQDEKEKLKNAYKKTSELIFLMSFIFCYMMIILTEPIITIFLGSKWLDSSYIFVIVTVSLIFHPFGRLGDSLFRSIGIVKQYFFVRVFLCVSSILLISAGCLLWEIKGLAIAYVLSRILDATIKMFLLNRIMGINVGNILKVPVMNFVIVTGLFIVAFILKFLLPSIIIGAIVSFLFFSSLLLFVSLVKPRLFGDIFYDNVYLYIKNNILCKNEKF